MNISISFTAPLPTDSKDTPFQSTLHSDVTYSQRHVEESWIHLLKAGDTLKLKTLTVCNFDFLLAAVSDFIFIITSKICINRRIM